MKNPYKNKIDIRYFNSGNNQADSALSEDITLKETYKLIYICSGNCEVDIDGISYYVSYGDSVLIFPRSRFKIVPNRTAKYVWVEIAGFEIPAILGRIAFSQKKPVLGKITKDGFEELFKMPCEMRHPYSLYRLSGFTMLLLSYYVEYFPRKSVETEGYISQAIKYIDENLSTPSLSVKDVTQALKIDRSHLYRIFKNELGVSVIDYIIHRRIYKSEIMLSNISLSIKDVAYSVGFTDQMYFSRVFKRINGRTPTEFRHILISEINSYSTLTAQ